MDREENSRLGVYWLIKASEQGNVEATNILKQCLETGQGEGFIANITVLTHSVNISNVDTDLTYVMVCLVYFLGITEHNYVDVKSCLSMSQDEKLVRRAAREMFTR